VLPRQEKFEGAPGESSLASLVDRLQAVPGVLEALLLVGVVLTKDAALYRGLRCVSTHDPKILAFKLLRAALASNADDFLNTDVKKMLQKLVQCVVRVTSA
jgi:hypothetical protein